MVQLEFLNGKRVGNSCLVDRFPFRIGRAAGCDLVVQEDGIWDYHLDLDLPSVEGVVVRPQAGTWVALNGERVGEGRVANGDVITVGALQIRFGFSPMRQRSLVWREAVTWIGLGLLWGVQLFLIWWLVQ